MLLDIENLAYELYKSHRIMRDYPDGIYDPYNIEPIASLNNIYDEYNKPINISKLDNYDLIINGDNEVIFDYTNKHFNKISLKPYMPYTPYKVLVEYVERYLDNMCTEYELGMKCPILGSVPILHDGYKTINEICRDNYGIRMPKKFKSIPTIDKQLEYISTSHSGDTVFVVTTSNKYINVEVRGVVKELRYELILEDIRLQEEVDRDNRVVAKDWDNF